MRPNKMLLTAVSALALFAGAFLSYPVAAAEAGFHLAYFSESSFITLTTGQIGQFSVGFTNTGDQSWQKGVAGKALSLHTAAPLDNTTNHTAGWSSGWVSSSIYANQLSDLVAPGQVGFFVYNVKVPAGAAAGAKTFYGRPVIDGVGPLEDYGYYQIATVTSTLLTITGTTPATPSTTSNPTVAGSGAPASTTVSILDGSTVVGSGTSTISGTFSIALTNALGLGAHSLTATATGATASAVFTYTVLTASTGGSTTTTTSGTLALSRPGTHSIIITASKALNTGPVTAAKYKWDSGTFPSTPTLQAGSLAVRLDFTSSTLPAAGTHTLDVYDQTFQDSTVFTPNPTSFTVVTTADSTAPSLSSATAVAANIVDLTFSEAMRTSTYFPVTNAIDVTARYTLQNPDGSAATTTGISGTGAAILATAATSGGSSSDAALYNETKARITFGANFSTTTVYTLVVANFADQAGNAVTTQSTTFQYTGTGILPTVSSVTATQLQLIVTYSKAMNHAAVANATATVCAGTGTQIDNKARYTLQGTMGTALGNAATTCFISSDERTVTFTFTPAVGIVQGSYTYSITGVSDNISTANLVSPDPTASTVTVANSAPKLATATFISTNSFSVTFSEVMSTSSATDTGSATNPNNYSVNGGTGGTGTGAYGDLCVTGGTLSVSTSDSKTFTILCTTFPGKWGTVNTTLQVRSVIDSDSSLALDPNPSAGTF